MSYKDPIDTCSHRLLIALSMSGLKQVDLINKTKIPKSAMSQYFSGRIKPKSDRLKLLADALGVSPAWLMGFDVPPVESRLPDGAIPYEPIRRIPVLGRISAGKPLYAEEQLDGTIAADVPPNGEYFALRVTGDSMDAARIFDGDLVIVKVVPEVPDKAIAIVRVNGDDATIKRFHQEGNIVQLIPQSTNPAHQVQIYDISKVRIEVIGQVIKSITQF